MRPRRTTTVTCSECDVEGELSFSLRKQGSVADLEDRIDHAEGCSLYKREQPRHLKKKNWARQERAANELVGARETPASGALGEDGDGRKFHMWRVESKQTIRTKFIVTNKVWKKLVKGALEAGEEPLLHVQVDVSGRPDAYVVVRLDLWHNATTDAPGHVKRPGVYPDISTPYVLDREPFGVVLTEHQFSQLREKFDAVLR